MHICNYFIAVHAKKHPEYRVSAVSLSQISRTPAVDQPGSCQGMSLLFGVGFPEFFLVMRLDVHARSMLDLSIYLTPSMRTSTLKKELLVTSAMNSEKTAHENEKMILCNGSTARIIHTFLKNTGI